MKSTNMRTITKDERLILDAVKARKYQHLTITVENGKIVLIRREETIKPNQNAKI